MAVLQTLKEVRRYQERGIGVTGISGSLHLFSIFLLIVLHRLSLRSYSMERKVTEML